MIHVLHVGKYYPPDAGGIESMTALLARGAAAAGMDVSVVCFAEHAHGDEVDAGVRVHRVAQALKPASQPLGVRYVFASLRAARRADVVHVHTPNMLAALIVRLMARRPRVVIHWHSDIIGKGLLARAMRPLEQAMLRRADRILATSAAYAAASPSLREHAHKVAVVPLGVPDAAAAHAAAANDGDAADPRAALPEALRAHIGDRPLVLCVGRLVPYKGYATLVDAIAHLRSDAAVVVVGRGPLQAELEARIAEAGAGSRLMLAGRLDDALLARLWRLASVFCMPSVERSEAFGVALVEAMASGLPLVATNIEGSGVPWVNQHGESGLNVAPGDAAALAGALDRLLADAPLRERFAAGARARYERLFTEEATVRATLAVYRAVCDEGLTPARPAS